MNAYTKKELRNVVQKNESINRDRLILYIEQNLSKTLRVFLFESFDENSIREELTKTFIGLARSKIIYDWVVEIPEDQDLRRGIRLNLSVEIDKRRTVDPPFGDHWLYIPCIIGM